jgi:nucleoside-diphosphate-sugar epimerase
MRVFVAGATGAVGKRLVPLLVARGHEVVAMTRERTNERVLVEAGARPAIADALDREAVVEAVTRAEPEVVVHELTSLAGATKIRNFDREFAVTNRLRTEGTDNLVEAARRSGAGRLVAQSFGNWNYERTGGPVKTESDPLDPDPPASMRQSLAAIEQLESAVVGNGAFAGVALRYGNLYGAGTGWTSPVFVELLRKRRLPIIGDGGGVFSFIHVDDAAIATVAAIEGGAPGIYNIADDEPAPVRVWLPILAQAVGAKPPRHVPAWLGRLAAGEAIVSMFTRIRGASNAKAKSELGWQLADPSWRQGFEHGLAETPLDPAAAERRLGVVARPAREGGGEQSPGASVRSSGR